MKIIKTYYLIDYENVGSEGFKGCEKLRETDIIHLFYTDNSRKIDLDIINDHGEAKLVTHKVPTGNQSADMHLGSYLGYLIGKECTGQDEECKIVVISKDTGFDHIIEFWKAEKNVKISRNEKISGKQVQTRKQVKKQTGKEKDKQVAEQTDQKIEKQLNEQPEKQSAKQSENQNTKKPKQKIIDMKAGTKSNILRTIFLRNWRATSHIQNKMYLCFSSWQFHTIILLHQNHFCIHLIFCIRVQIH